MRDPFIDIRVPCPVPRSGGNGVGAEGYDRGSLWVRTEWVLAPSCGPDPPVHGCPVSGC